MSAKIKKKEQASFEFFDESSRIKQVLEKFKLVLKIHFNLRGNRRKFVHQHSNRYELELYHLGNQFSQLPRD